MAAHDGGNVVVVVLVVTVVEVGGSVLGLVVVVGRTSVQSVSAQLVSPTWMARLHRLPSTHVWARTARQRRPPVDTRSAQQTTLPGRPQVDCRRSPLHVERSTPARSAARIVSPTHAR